MLDIVIPYGADNTLEFSLHEANLKTILEPPDAPGVEDIRGEIRLALKNPISTHPLAELATGKKDVVILADDMTRLTPTRKIIPEILNELNQGGVSEEKIRLVIALGTHRPMTEREILEKFGEEVVERIPVLNHDFRNPDALVDLGRTENGTPIKINKLVYEADLVIGVGSVYPHHIAGFAGGAKIVQPGVSGSDTTGFTHLLAAKARPSLLGKVENYVRKEMENVALRANMKIILNTVLNQKGETVKAFYGDLIHAHRKAVELSRRVHSARFENKVDIVVAGSHPMDIEFWQAHKSLYPAEIVAKPGGTIIIVTPCPEGVTRTHADMLEFTIRTPEEIEAGVVSGEIKDTPGAALAIAWSIVRQDHQICIVSDGISPKEADSLGFVHFTEIDQALKAAFKKHGKGASVAVLPRAPETLPITHIQ